MGNACCPAKSSPLYYVEAVPSSPPPLGFECTICMDSDDESDVEATPMWARVSSKVFEKMAYASTSVSVLYGKRGFTDFRFREDQRPLHTNRSADPARSSGMTSECVFGKT